MKLARLLALSLGVTTIVLGGCASTAEEGPSDDSGESEGASSASTSTGYVLDDGELGKVYFRLSKTGSALSGYAFQEAPQGVGAIPRMDVTGTASGKAREIELTHFWGAKVKFTLKTGAGGVLSGTRDGSNTGPYAVKLVPVAATLASPLVLSYTLDKGQGGCELRLNGVELFGMKDAAREATLNATLAASAAAASQKCVAGADSVLGGAWVGVVDDAIQTWSSVYDIDQPSGYATFGERRVNQYADGADIPLWNDVLVSGAASEVKLAQLVEAAVERTIGRGLIEVIGQTRKDELKVKMAARLASGELATDFLLGKTGIAFGTNDFDPRVRAVLVPYADLQAAGLLAPNGKAKSAWK